MALLPQDSYDKPGAVCYPHTPELLVGRNPIANAPASSNFAADSDYADTTSSPQDGAIYLQGFWHLTSEAAVSGESNGYLALRYHAIQLVVVMRPEAGERSASTSRKTASPWRKRTPVKTCATTSAAVRMSPWTRRGPTISS